MKFLDIYKDNTLKASGTISSNQDKFTQETGVFELNQFIINIIGLDTQITDKILAEKNFILSLEEKVKIKEQFEKYIDDRVEGLKQKEIHPLDKTLEYKGETYWYNPKSEIGGFEKEMARAVALFNIFSDPDNTSKIEMKFTTEIE